MLKPHLKALKFNKIVFNFKKTWSNFKWNRLVRLNTLFLYHLVSKILYLEDPVLMVIDSLFQMNESDE